MLPRPLMAMWRLISDTGMGIPKEHFSKIFYPFFTIKGVGKGTGLGLNVTCNIIKSIKEGLM